MTIEPSYLTQQASSQRFISQFAFRSRVGDDVVALLELGAMHQANDSQGVQLAKAKQRAQMARCFSAQYLDLDSEELRAGFATVPQQVFNRIFLEPVQDKERP